jgi:threonylcarbamoyladenosine tRNA methylthiotransferase MtaB
MASFYIENFGCRATDADAAALRGGVSARGLALCGESVRADFVILNTCTVTAAADSQAREAIRKIHRANPAARIIVTGCYAQRAPEELAGLDGVAWVVANSRQREIPALIAEGAAGIESGLGSGTPKDFVPLESIEQSGMSLAHGAAKILTSDIFAQTSVQLAPASLMAGERTRPILKIQDGCNNRCAYCVIPFVRGRSRSLTPDTVVSEVRELVRTGAKEVVLSGINLGSYGRDLTPRADLAHVVRRILAETDLDQLRFSSIEPQDVTEDFVSLVASSPRLAPHFHVPLQSGSDRTLRAMHRWYRTALYAERIGIIRRLLPNAAIGADVIAGFPGEDDDDFAGTLEFIESQPFTYLHVFSFSMRPGTEASTLEGGVPQRVVRERARALRALSASKTAAFREAQAGRRMRALTLLPRGARSEEGWTEALTPNYLKVRVAGQWPANEWREITVGKQLEDGLGTVDLSGLENHLSKSDIAAVRD